MPIAKKRSATSLKDPKDKKIKRKVGKKVPLAANATRTDFKTRGINVPTQTVLKNKEGQALNLRQLSLSELLSQVTHHNTNSRKDALSGLRQLLELHPGLILSHFGAVLQGTITGALDVEESVRQAEFALLSYLFAHVQPHVLQPFLKLLVSYVCSALSHIHKGIRRDAVLLLTLLLRPLSKLSWPTPLILQVLTNVLGVLTERMTVLKSEHAVMPDSPSSSTPTSTTPRKKKSVVSLLMIVECVEKVLSLITTSSGLGVRVGGAGGVGGVGVGPLLPPQWPYGSKGPVVSPVSEQCNIDLSYSDPSFWSNENESSSDTLLGEKKEKEGDNALRAVMDPLIPTLIECWVEAMPTKVISGPQGEEAASCIAALARCLLLVFNVHRDVFRDAESITDGHRKDLFTHVFSYFPLHGSGRIFSHNCPASILQSANMALAHLLLFFCETEGDELQSPESSAAVRIVVQFVVDALDGARHSVSLPVPEGPVKSEASSRLPTLTPGKVGKRLSGRAPSTPTQLQSQSPTVMGPPKTTPQSSRLNPNLHKDEARMAEILPLVLQVVFRVPSKEVRELFRQFTLLFCSLSSPRTSIENVVHIRPRSAVRKPCLDLITALLLQQHSEEVSHGRSLTELGTIAWEFAPQWLPVLPSLLTAPCSPTDCGDVAQVLLLLHALARHQTSPSSLDDLQSEYMSFFCTQGSVAEVGDSIETPVSMKGNFFNLPVRLQLMAIDLLYSFSALEGSSLSALCVLCRCPDIALPVRRHIVELLTILVQRNDQLHSDSISSSLQHQHSPILSLPTLLSFLISANLPSTRPAVTSSEMQDEEGNDEEVAEMMLRPTEDESSYSGLRRARRSAVLIDAACTSLITVLDQPPLWRGLSQGTGSANIMQKWPPAYILMTALAVPLCRAMHVLGNKNMYLSLHARQQAIQKQHKTVVKEGLTQVEERHAVLRLVGLCVVEVGRALTAASSRNRGAITGDGRNFLALQWPHDLAAKLPTFLLDTALLTVEADGEGVVHVRYATTVGVAPTSITAAELMKELLAVAQSHPDLLLQIIKLLSQRLLLGNVECETAVALLVTILRHRSAGFADSPPFVEATRQLRDTIQAIGAVSRALLNTLNSEFQYVFGV